MHLSWKCLVQTQEPGALCHVPGSSISGPGMAIMSATLLISLSTSPSNALALRRLSLVRSEKYSFCAFLILQVRKKNSLGVIFTLLFGSLKVYTFLGLYSEDPPELLYESVEEFRVLVDIGHGLTPPGS